MDLASRKLAFVQAFLNLEDEGIISGLQEMLNQKLTELKNNELQPKSIDEFNKEIQQSIIDSDNDHGTDAFELKAEIKKWS